MRPWIKFPRDNGGWGIRADTWLDELTQATNTTEADLATAEADIAALELNRLGYARAALLSWNTTTTTSAVSAMSVTASLQAGKVYKVSFSTHFYSTVAGDALYLRFVGPGATPIYTIFQNVAFGASTVTATSGFFYFTAPTTDNYTIFLQYYRAAGTGNVSVYADATIPSFMTIEPFQ